MLPVYGRNAMKEHFVLSPLHKRSIFVHIVEPDQEFGNVLMQIFRYEGFECFLSTTAESYLSELNHRVPDVVISNLYVGDQCGHHLFNKHE